MDNYADAAFRTVQTGTREMRMNRAMEISTSVAGDTALAAALLLLPIMVRNIAIHSDRLHQVPIVPHLRVERHGVDTSTAHRPGSSPTTGYGKGDRLDPAMSMHRPMVSTWHGNFLMGLVPYSSSLCWLNRWNLLLFMRRIPKCKSQEDWRHGNASIKR